MKKIIYIIILVTTYIIFFGTIAEAQNSIDQQQKSLEVIADFAERICKDIPLEGKEGKLELSGRAKVELKGILKKLADLGLEGSAKYEESEYEGLLRSDLVQALQDSTSCKLKIIDMLTDKLIPATSNSIYTPFIPNPPSMLKTHWDKKKGFLITWADNSVNELGFNIYRKYESYESRFGMFPPLTGKPPGYKFIRTIPANKTEYFDSEIYYFDYGDRIFYKVSSYNESGESEKMETGLATARDIIIE